MVCRVWKVSTAFVAAGRLDVRCPVVRSVLCGKITQPEEKLLVRKARKVQMQRRTAIQRVRDLSAVQNELVRDRGLVGFRKIEIRVVDLSSFAFSVKEVVLLVPLCVLDPKRFSGNQFGVELDSVCLSGILVLFLEHAKDFRNEVFVFLVVSNFTFKKFCQFVNSAYRILPPFPMVLTIS